MLLGNRLDIATALTSLALFKLLRFPLFMFPQVINNVVEATVSVERIQSYLLAKDRIPVHTII
jgi:ATP-binding cassette, subfamily C (CFTR/MRP), member 1